MQDWIKKHKESLKAAENSYQQRDARKDHERSVVRSKAPEFWSILVTEVEEQAADLSQGNPEYLTTFQKTNDSFTLRRASNPETSLQATLDVRMCRVITIISKIENIFSKQRQETKSEFRIYPDENDQMHFYFANGDYWRPEDLAGRFVRLVCGIPEEDQVKTTGA